MIVVGVTNLELKLKMCALLGGAIVMILDGGKDFSNFGKVGNSAPRIGVNGRGQDDVGKLLNGFLSDGTSCGSFPLGVSNVLPPSGSLGPDGTSLDKVGSISMAPEVVVVPEATQLAVASVDGKSWSNLFGAKLKEKISSPLMDFFSNPSVGDYFVSVSDCIIDKGILSMEQSLVGKFLGPHTNIELVCNLIRNQWHLKGHVQVEALAKGFFSFSFTCDEDLLKVLVGGAWVIGKSTLVLKKWEAGFSSSSYSFDLASVWVHLPRLPLEFWDEKVFKGIVSTFGCLLSIDNLTASRHRLVYARLCVILDQATDLPSMIKINSMLGVWEQVVEFESIPFSCFHYKKVGHWVKDRPLKLMVPPEKASVPSQKDAKFWKEVGKCHVSEVEMSSIEPLEEVVFEGPPVGVSL